jgi:hypothetical protein
VTKNPKPDLYPDQWITHDSAENQERERAIIQRYCEATNAGGYDHKGIGSRFDAEVYTNDLGELREIIEVKIRRARRREVDFYNLDMKKADWLRSKSRQIGVPAFLVVRWSDDELTRLNLSNADTREWRVKLHKHPTRKEFPDLQYLIPVQEFERI